MPGTRPSPRQNPIGWASAVKADEEVMDSQTLVENKWLEKISVHFNHLKTKKLFVFCVHGMNTNKRQTTAFAGSWKPCTDRRNLEIFTYSKACTRQSFGDQIQRWRVNGWDKLEFEVWPQATRFKQWKIALRRETDMRSTHPRQVTEGISETAQANTCKI